MDEEQDRVVAAPDNSPEQRGMYRCGDARCTGWHTGEQDAPDED